MKNNYNFEVCIVGLGSAGIGAALTLSNSNLSSRVLCLDAGKHSSTRSCSILQNRSCKKENPCQIISGFGGCSLLGGGKVSSFPAGRRLVNILGSRDFAEKKISEALGLFSNYLSFHKSILSEDNIKNGRKLFGKWGFEYRYYDVYVYDQDELRKAYQKIFLQLKSAGMSLLLSTELIKIDCAENGFKLVVKQGEKEVTIFTKYVVLGVGRLGRTMLKSLNTKLNLGGKENHLDVGVRLEFPTDLYPDMTKYHNDLKLLFDDARTFCVCKGGKIMPYLLDHAFFTEGYYNPRYASDFTNLGIMIRLEPSKRNETLLQEIKERSLHVNNVKPACQSLLDYLTNDTKNYKSSRSLKSSISFWTQSNVTQCFPQSISAKIKEAVSYFATRLLPTDYWDEVGVFAPEVDYGGLSFPVNSDFSIIPKMYLIGDCTGRFRGILQAFCSGIICAESIIDGIYKKNL